MLIPTKGLRFFFIITFLAAVAFPFVNFYYIFPLFSDVVVQSAEKDAILLAHHLSEMVYEKGGELRNTRDSGKTIGKVVQDFNLWKLRVYSTDGVILLSSVPGEKGQRHHEDFFLSGTVPGEPVSELVRKDAYTIEGERASRDVLEIIVPVEGQDGPKGAFEIYYDVTGQLRGLHNAVTRSAIVLLSFVFIIFISVLVFLVRIDKSTYDEKSAVPMEPLTGQSPYYLLLVLVLAVFVSEVAVMLLLSVFPTMPKGSKALLDAMLLVLLVSPALYLFLLRPLLGHIRKLNVAEERLRNSLNEKDVLLKEVHHRVKNNLQVISSLLGLQSRRVDDPVAQSVLLESESRIHSMAMIHEMLYATDNLATIRFSDFVRDLSSRVIRQFHGDNKAVSLSHDIPDVHFNVDTLIPCGLILNELLTNAFKYAFPDGGKGELKISLSEDGQGRYTLSVKDNGVGLPKAFDIWRTKSLGLQIVRSMSAKLEGDLDVINKNGSEFRVSFKAKNP